MGTRLRFAFLCVLALATQAGAQPARIAAEVLESTEQLPRVLVTIAVAQGLRTALLDAPTDYTDAAAVKAYVERSAGLFASIKDKLLASAPGLRRVRDYPYLPVFLAEIVEREPAFTYLGSAPEVSSVRPNTPHRLFTKESLPIIRQPEAARYGALGEGGVVAVLDTGIDVSAFGCKSHGPGCVVIHAKRIPRAARPSPVSPHGTNVAAIVRATAPKARLIDLDVFTTDLAFAEDVEEAINWVVANRATYNIVTMNLSLGSAKFTSACSESAYSEPIAHALRAGIVTVAASGNDAWLDGMAEPACVATAISVGAVYDSDGAYPRCNGGKRDAITCFTNRSKFLGLLAPGADIEAGGVTRGGTSQAAPFVTGAVAALWSFFRRAKPQEIRQALLDSGARIKDPNSGLDFRRLDVESAFHLAKQRNLPQ